MEIAGVRFDQLSIRSLDLGDADRVLDLMRRCEIAEYGEHDSDLVDLHQDWSQMDLATDGWLVTTPSETTLGYAAVIPRGKEVQVDVYVDPAWSASDLGQELLSRCIDRVWETLPAQASSQEVVVRAYIAHVNERDAEILQAAGFSCVEHHFQMQALLDASPPDPRWPSGVVVRTAVPGRDDRKIYELIARAFRRPGEPPTPFEEWQSGMMGAELFDPDLWFLAEQGTEMVGACLCFCYPDLGWVRQLGVEDRWRRQGIGGALLRQSFGAFYRRGFKRVGLGVRAHNETAVHFYEKAGMKIVRQYDQYNRKFSSREQR